VAELKFFYGTMGSGKSTQALQIHHNLSAQDLKVLLTTQLDRMGGQVSSRLGITAKAEVLTASTNLLELALAQQRFFGLDAVVCDEAQFYEPKQIDQLARIVDELDVNVFAFGLLTSFQGELFPASQRLLELADTSVQIQVEARCWCGQRATHNARLVDGRQVYSGDLKVVGDTADRSDAKVTYELRCRAHWMEAKLALEGDQLRLDMEVLKTSGDTVSWFDDSPVPAAPVDRNHPAVRSDGPSTFREGILTGPVPKVPDAVELAPDPAPQTAPAAPAAPIPAPVATAPKRAVAAAPEAERPSPPSSNGDSNGDSIGDANGESTNGWNPFTDADEWREFD